MRVLDPACGSGNFLYVALQLLKDLEKETLVWGAEAFEGASVATSLIEVGPSCLSGIEINTYAAELARVAIWIGELQWMMNNGYGYHREPVLRPLDAIRTGDAILEPDGLGGWSRPQWPEAEFIIGNPPFLGVRKLRTQLGDDYVEHLFAAWKDRVPHEADLVCYWHEMTREVIEQGRTKRGGLLATNSIRGGANRRVLDRIKASGDIFMAWSDEPWVVDGAAVRVSIVGQDDGSETTRFLDDREVADIHADLSSGTAQGGDMTTVAALRENEGVSFMGDTKGGAFDIPSEVAEQMLRAPKNVNGRSNRDVVRPWVNGLDLTRRPRGMWIIDFGVDMTRPDAAAFELPFEHTRAFVEPERRRNKRESYREKWWLHVETRPALRESLAPLSRFIATARVAKHRLFVWLFPPTLPDCQVIVVARSDDFAFGVLHSRAHEVWALKLGTSLEDRPRYTPSSTFETFPFPWPLTLLRQTEPEQTWPQDRA